MTTVIEKTTTLPVAPPSGQSIALEHVPVAIEPAEVLPHPPSDIESVAYFARHGRFLATWYFFGTVGLVIAFTSLIQTESSFAVFAPYFVLLSAWLGVSSYANLWPRDPSLSAHRDRVAAWAPADYPSVDVWLPVCGEPLAVLENTWRAVAMLDWPGELTVHVGDDRPSEDVESLAGQFGFEYHVRARPGQMKKAGNLLHLFDNSNGDFVAIFDADFAPREDFFRQLVPYFDDEGVGIVQSPQYFAPGCNGNWLQQGAGAVQEFFYRATQTGRTTRGGAICVGTSAIYRRAALESNGGPAQVPLSEDVHTGIELMSHGWRLHYLPIVLSAGLCPDNKRSYFNQQYRWCTGSMNLVRSRKFWSIPMPWRQRICFLCGSSCYLTNALSAICGPPFVFMLACIFPEIVRIENYLVLLPLITLQFVVLPLWNNSRIGLNSRSTQLRNSWTHVYAILDIVRGRSAAWVPSGNAGESSARTKRVDFSILIWTGGLFFAATIGVLVNFVSRPVDFVPMLAFLLFVLAMVVRNMPAIKPRASERHRGRGRTRPAAIGLCVALTFLTVLFAATPSALATKLGVSGSPGAFSKLERSGFEILASFEAWSNDRDARTQLRRARSVDATPMITWEPWSPPPLGSKDQGARQVKYSNRSIVAGKHDKYIRAFAKSLAKHRKLVYLRFAHEFPGSWYPWSKDPAAYRQAWKRIHRIFHRARARNVKFAWSPQIYGSSGREEVMKYWPGSRYVDFVSTSFVYFGPKTHGHHQGLINSLNELKNFNKPALIAEANTEYSNRHEVMTDLVTYLKENRWIRALVWTQTESRAQRDWADVNMEWSLSADSRARGILKSLR